MPDASGWDVVAALGSAVGALAGAAAAGAAWRAALTSERASAEARQALALSIAPQVSVDVSSIGTEIQLRIINLSRWTAADLEVVVEYADGKVLRTHRERLISFGSGDSDDWWVPLRTVTDDWPSRTEAEALDVAVRFSDERSIARYEVTFRAFLRGAPNDRSVAVDSHPMGERRIQ